MANLGTQINRIIKSQGFDYLKFDAVSLGSTPTGLRFTARFEKRPSGYGRRLVHVNVDVVEAADGNVYTISFDNQKNVVADSVAQQDLGGTLDAVLQQEASRV